MVRPRVRKGSDKGRNPLWLDLDPKSVEKKSWINKSWILYRCIWRWIRVSQMNAVARIQLTFQMLILFKKIPTTRANIQQHGTANVWPWYLKWLEHSAWIRRLGVRDPLRSRHFLSEKLDALARTPVRVSKMNAVARTQLTFQMLALLQICICSWIQLYKWKIQFEKRLLRQRLAKLGLALLLLKCF